MQTIEKIFFLILVILIGIGLLEGYKAFLGFISQQWGSILLIDVVFLLFLFIYQIKRSVIFGILASIFASFLFLSLLEYSWNLFLLIPILGILSIKNKNQKWQIKSTGLSLFLAWKNGIFHYTIRSEIQVYFLFWCSW